MRPGISSLVLAGAFAVGTSAVAQEILPRVSPEEAGLQADPLARITATLEESVSGRRIAGAVVGIARHGKVGYLRAVGARDLESGSAMTERSLFRVYSMTKTVTAVAVMILHEEGRFELSDPVARYLPELADAVVLNADGTTRPPTRPITVEHLLLHTAGLSHRSSPEYRDAGVRSRSIPLERFVQNVARVPLRFDPGDRYLYSAAPTVLGRLVEVLSGVPFDEFLDQRILGPLGMDDTGFWVAPADQERLSTVYATDGGGVLRPFQIEEVPFTERPALLEGAVGLVSTVPDFLRFSQMLLNGGELGGVRILEERTVAMMTRNGLSEPIVASRGGNGWGLGNVAVAGGAAASPGGARPGEYGWNGSAGTAFMVDPSAELVVVTMWQSSPSNPDGLRERLMELARRAAAD